MPIHEIEEADDILRRREVAEVHSEERRLGGKLGDEEGRKPDEAAPDHPPYTLIILGRLSLAPSEQDAERTEIDDKAEQNCCARDRLAWIAERARIGRKQK